MNRKFIGICGEQCPEVGELITEGIPAEQINEQIIAACYDRNFSCATGGPNPENKRCGLEPEMRYVARAVVLGVTRPLKVPEHPTI